MLRRITRWTAVLVVAMAAVQSVTAAPRVGYLKIKGDYPERHVRPSFLSLGDDDATFRELVDSVYDAANRAFKLDGFLVRLTDAKLTTTQIEELGDALDQLRAGGTKVYVFTEIYGAAELLIGAHADEVIIQSGGAISLPGLYMQEMFLADALRTVGIEPDYVQIGDYKGAAEPMSRSAPSEQWNQNINQLLDGMYANLRSALAAGRGLTNTQLDQAMEQSLLASPQTAIDVGLIDTSLDRLDLDDHLAKALGGAVRWDKDIGPGSDKRPDFASMNFFEAFSQLMTMVQQSRQRTNRDTIAIVHIDGPIIDGESTSGGLLQGAGVGSLTIRKALAEIEDDQNIKGVIVRINSPGGSAIASESIWLGLRRLTQSRPVWTSVGTMAASGGYYIAVAGDRIYVDPSSIVGSIGVVGGKLATSGLYKKLHINVVSRARGPRAAMMGSLDPWTPADRQFIRRRMTETYDLFVSRVSAGRRNIDISTTAEGRLFTGRRAIEVEMADSLGGIHQAIAGLADELGLSAGSFDVIDYPPPPTIEEFLEHALPMTSAQAPSSLAVLREVVGDRVFDQLQDSLTALLQLRREPVLLVSPRVLLFH